MANRYYEALMCDVVPLFAPNTSKTLKGSNYSSDIATSQILPEGLYGDGLLEYISKLDHSYYINNQRSQFDNILGEREMVLQGIKDFLT